MTRQIKKLRKQLEKKLEKLRGKCVDNAYDPEKKDWNPKHFKYCEADLVARQLDLLDKLEEIKK